MPLVHQIIGEPGAAESLQYLATSSETSFPRAELENVFEEQGVAAPARMIDEFLATNILEPFGERFGISTLGQRTSLLVEAINGGDIEEVYRRLRRLSGSREMYEIARGRMTSIFFQTLLDRPGFGRLYICSPWVNPTEKEAAYLKYAVYKQQERKGIFPNVLLVTRPPNMMPTGTEKGLQPFIDIGASIYFNRRLHSKLYMRDPDDGGGYSLAIVGSQNLTKSRHLELGIRINGDSQIIGQLIAYFLDLLSWSVER